MKKLLILAAAVFALGTSTVSADNDRPISVSELPEKAQQFIRQHFPNEKVSFAKMERELFDTTYEVIFTSSSKVEFLKNGDWKEVDCKYSTVPAAIIPQQIAQYVSQYYPDTSVVQIDRDKRDLRGEAHQRVGVDVRPEIQPDRHRRLTLSDGSSGDRPKMKAAPGATHCARGGLFVACR